MTVFQRIVKYCAVGFAVYLVIVIVGGLLAGVGGLSFLSDRFGDREASDAGKIYEVGQDIGEIEIELAAADCEILTGDRFSVESSSSALKVKSFNGRLEITDSVGSINDGVRLKLYIPSDAQLKRIDISAGAGDIYAERLACSSLSIECGAGDVEIAEAVATVKAEIDGGVGEITVSAGSMNDLELDMGIGSLRLTNRLRGVCDLDFGIGDADITLVGTAEDYALNYDAGDGLKTRVNIDKGIGTVNIVYAEAG